MPPVKQLGLKPPCKVPKDPASHLQGRRKDLRMRPAAAKFDRNHTPCLFCDVATSYFKGVKLSDTTLPERAVAAIVNRFGHRSSFLCRECVGPVHDFSQKMSGMNEWALDDPGHVVINCIKAFLDRDFGSGLALVVEEDRALFFKGVFERRTCKVQTDLDATFKKTRKAAYLSNSDAHVLAIIKLAMGSSSFSARSQPSTLEPSAAELAKAAGIVQSIREGSAVRGSLGIFFKEQPGIAEFKCNFCLYMTHEFVVSRSVRFFAMQELDSCLCAEWGCGVALQQIGGPSLPRLASSQRESSSLNSRRCLILLYIVFHSAAGEYMHALFRRCWADVSGRWEFSVLTLEFLFCELRKAMVTRPRQFYAPAKNRMDQVLAELQALHGGKLIVVQSTWS